MTNEIKTWAERMFAEYGHDARNWKPDEYMIAEINELRAALAAPSIASSAPADQDTVIRDAIRVAYMQGYDNGKDDGKANSGCSRYVPGNVEAKLSASVRAAIAAQQAAPAATMVEALKSALAIINNEADPDEYAAPLLKIRAALASLPVPPKEA